jgi:hypothetical protein
MKSLMVGEVKNHFSDILAQVQNDDVTMPRKIGILNGKASFKAQGNGKITEEVFWGNIVKNKHT